MILGWSNRRFFAALVAVLLGAWLYGFFSYILTVIDYKEPLIDSQTEPTDAIVVLTGGSERLSVGLNLLRDGKAKKLLISGVHPSVKIESLLQTDDEYTKNLKDCCIVLGKTADNTLGNAIETESFMKQEGFTSLRLVTAHYHMPRSLLLFQKHMADKTIYAHPVSPDIVDLDYWWFKTGTLMLLVGEYNKYLFAQLRSRMVEE